jgi:membrane protein DedA with SNARE-associated domain
MASLIATYGYVAILVGTFLEGETILVLGGFAAYKGYLQLPWVILTAFAGSFSGDQLFFFLGRKYSATILANRPSWQKRADRAQALLARYRTLLILMFRFMYGFRTVTPFVIGASPIPTVRFFFLNAISALAWATAIGTGGYFFGQVMEIFLGKVKHYEVEVLVGVAALVGIVVLFQYFHRRKAGSSSSKNKH